MAHDDPVSAHRAEFILGIAARGAATGMTTGLTDEQRDEVSLAYADVALEAYGLGRRHALCDLIREVLGPGHPADDRLYRFAVETRALTDPDAAVDAAFIERLTDPKLALGRVPPADRRN